MCGSKGGNSNAAEQQRLMEQQRAAAITAEQTRINDAFKAYDDPEYFSGVSKAYVDHYIPELGKQYENAREQLIYTRPGGGNSSSYNEQIAGLEEERMKQESLMRDQANSFANNYRNTIEGERSALLSLASTNAGNGVAAQQAVAKSAALSTPPAYSALGDVFSNYTNTLAQAAQARSAGYNVPGIIPDIRVGSTSNGASRTVA